MDLSRFDWRREDSAYAAAAAGAGVIVVFLIAGNFGLVPSPLSTVPEDPPLPIAVSSFGIQAAGPPQPAPPTVFVQPTPAPPVVVPQPTVPPEPADTTGPSVSIAATNNEVRGPTSTAPISGAVSDAQSGVASVRVAIVDEFGDREVIEANLECDGTRRSCSWNVPAPTGGRYTFTATASDFSANTASTEPVTITFAEPVGLLGRLIGLLI